MKSSRLRHLFNVAAIVVIGAISTSDPTSADGAVSTAREPSTFELKTSAVSVVFLVETGQLVLTSADGHTRREIEMSMRVDGFERPVALRPEDVVRRHETGLTGMLSVQVGEERWPGTIDLAVDPEINILTAAVTVPASDGKPHVLSLHLSIAPGLATIFVPEHGEVMDLGDVEARSVVLDDNVHPLAIAARHGVLTVGLSGPELEMQPGAKPHLGTMLSMAAEPGQAFRTEASIVFGTSDVFWGALYGLLGVPFARVTGVVGGTTGRADVYALDEAGHPLVRVPTTAGRFIVDAPLAAVRWYATLETAHTSTMVARYQPGDPAELRLEMVKGGELRVRVLDADTGLPVLARIVVRGIEGTVDPTFGRDFRSAGTGPIVDARSGEMATTLAPGRYRVSALKGLEWSIDSAIVDMASGHGSSLELFPRHVVPTPGLVACDLHVHARPSFDSDVTPEDRLLSLASAGIDFAVPTEHNIVGDYTAAVPRVALEGVIGHVPGIEVTTYYPRFGHFGIFPYPKSAAQVPFQHTSARAVFAAARKGDPSRVLVVHHPRQSLGLGYFQVAGFDRRSGKIPSGMRTDFDVIEVYSGYEITTRATTEAVLADWFALLNMGKRYPASGSSDSHKLQFQWAGYPRTYVELPLAEAGDTGAPIDVKAVVAAVKSGQGLVTSGPIVDLDVSGARPGKELVVSDRHVHAHLRVRAAPWVDVSRIQVVAGGVTIFETELESRPCVTGKEHGSLDEAERRALRFDGDLELTLPPGAKWVVAIVRGDRAYDDVLPFMPVQPLGFTNPIWLK